MRRSFQSYLAGTLLGLIALVFSPAHARAAEDAHAPHGTEEHAAHDGHGAEGDHGAHDEHTPTFDDVNWFYGFIGEKADVEPSLLWRKPGMPVPVGVLLLNTGILFYLMFRFGKAPLQRALQERRARIVKGIEDASKMKAEAEASLAEYEQKLQQIGDQIDRVRTEMRQMGEVERERILAEARERRIRMEKEAQILIEQEIKAARQLLHQEVVEGAFKSAREALEKQVTQADHQRLGQAYLASVTQSAKTFSEGGKA